MNMSVVLPEYDIPRIIASFEKYVKRAERRLEEMKDQLQCDICYEGYKSCEYQCNHHRVCKICYSKIHLCPFCRAPQVGVYPDLWFFDQEGDCWFPLTERMVADGLSSDFDYKNYADAFDSACRAAHLYITHVARVSYVEGDSPRAIKQMIRVVADCFNRRTNFIVFAWHRKEHLHYCADRWRLVQETIVRQTQTNPEQIPELRMKLKLSLCRLLKKIKEVATKAGLRYRTG